MQKFSYSKVNYEVTNGVDNLEEKDNSELLPPFLKGEKNKLLSLSLEKYVITLMYFSDI